MARKFRYTLDRRIINRMIVWMLKHGSAPRSYYLLTVVGRVSGKPHSVPVALVEEKDHRWLVAPYGEVDWVKNARVSNFVRLSRGNQDEDFRICQKPPDSAAPILKKYLKKYPITRSYFNARADSPTEEFIEEARNKPVFDLIEANSS